MTYCVFTVTKNSAHALTPADLSHESVYFCFNLGVEVWEFWLLLCPQCDLPFDRESVPSKVRLNPSLWCFLPETPIPSLADTIRLAQSWHCNRIHVRSEISETHIWEEQIAWTDWYSTWCDLRCAQESFSDPDSYPRPEPDAFGVLEKKTSIPDKYCCAYIFGILNWNLIPILHWSFQKLYSEQSPGYNLIKASTCVVRNTWGTVEKVLIKMTPHWDN